MREAVKAYLVWCPVGSERSELWPDDLPLPAVGDHVEVGEQTLVVQWRSWDIKERTLEIHARELGAALD